MLRYARLHQRDCSLHADEDAFNIDFLLPPKMFDRRAFERPGHHYAGIVDEDIEASDLARHMREDLCPIGLGRNVVAERDRGAGRNGRNRLLDRGKIDVSRNNFRAEFREEVSAEKVTAYLGIPKFRPTLAEQKNEGGGS